MLMEEIDQAIVQAHHLQVPGDEFLKLVRERMTALMTNDAPTRNRED
jgi:hypothetical protein